MLALVKTAKGPDNMELRDMPEPSPGPGEVLIEVKAAGVCGTDIHVRHDQFPYWPPVIMGHEFAGVIAELGEGVADYELGERVVAEPHTRACGKCYLCRTGNRQLCAHKRAPGWGIDGAFTKYLVMPAELLHRLPDNVSFEAGALVEPLANVVDDVLLNARVEAEDFVVVLGPGPIGLRAAMCFKAEGEAEVMIVGTPADSELRLPTAEKVGIDHVVNLAEQDPLALTVELTGGRGADLVVECSGAGPAVNAAFQHVRKQGRICAIGMTGGKKIELDWDQAMFKDCTVYFNVSTRYEAWDRTISLLAKGKIDADALISHREPLENWEQVFADIESQKALKALLIPS